MIDLERLREESDRRCLARTVLAGTEARRQRKARELARRKLERKTNRPPEPERQDARLQVPLPRSLLEAVKAEAQRQRRAQSWVVRRAIEQFIADGRTA